MMTTEMKTETKVDTKAAIVSFLKSLISATKYRRLRWRMGEWINGASSSCYQAVFKNKGLKFLIYENENRVYFEVRPSAAQNQNILLSINDFGSDDDVIVLKYRLYNLVVDRSQSNSAASEISDFMSALSAN